MADLPEEVDRLIWIAGRIATLAERGTFGRAPGSADCMVQALFPSPEQADAFQFVLTELTLHMQGGTGRPPAPTAIGSAALEAQPTKPLDVDVRQWAMRMAFDVYGAPLDGTPLRPVMIIAEMVAQYALTGAMPPVDLKSEVRT